MGATVNAVIYFDGSVTYLPPGMFKSTCIIKIDDFPFDEQVCELKFGSWTYDESAVTLQNKSSTGQVDSYIKNGEWFLKGNNSNKTKNNCYHIWKLNFFLLFNK